MANENPEIGPHQSLYFFEQVRESIIVNSEPGNIVLYMYILCVSETKNSVSSAVSMHHGEAVGLEGVSTGRYVRSAVRMHHKANSRYMFTTYIQYIYICL